MARDCAAILKAASEAPCAHILSKKGDARGYHRSESRVRGVVLRNCPTSPVNLTVDQTTSQRSPLVPWWELSVPSFHRERGAFISGSVLKELKTIGVVVCAFLSFRVSDERGKFFVIHP